MDQAGEQSSLPVYGPPRPPEMLEAMRDAERQAEDEAHFASGDYCRCSQNHQEDLEGLRESESESDAAHIDRHHHHEHSSLLDDQSSTEPQEQAQGYRSLDRDGENGSSESDSDYEPANSALDDVSDDQDDDLEAQVLRNMEAEHGTGETDEENADDDDGEEEEEDDDDDEEDNVPIASLSVGGGLGGFLTRTQLIRILQTQNLSDVFDFDDTDESDDETLRPYRRRPRPRAPPPVVRPTQEGMKLQRSGAFGANETEHRGKKHRLRRMLDREHGLGTYEDRRRNLGLLTQDMLPEMRADQIIHYDEPVYSGQFSDDGNFYYSVCQDFKVRMYDTSNPYNWKHYKTVSYPWGSWTLTDASLSPDNKWLAYSSHSPTVSIAPTDPQDSGEPYNLNLQGGGRATDHERLSRMNMSIFSIRFSGDGRELVAGTRQNTIVLYDIERRKVLHTILGHENDVNAVCFGDKDEPHIIYSGSDDGVLKVWDRRSLHDRREAGAFVGHRGGLTYIDSKNDGRYVLSNGKDQTAKLWDIRMAYSTERFHGEDMTQYTRFAEHDYRYMEDGDVDYQTHPMDNSLVTYRGHKVMRTLIRCHFAPPDSANSRYVYSGSFDGKVHIWNMDSTVAKVIDVAKATRGSRRNDGRRRYYAFEDDGSWETCVRDVSWHPHAPIMAASAWNSYNMARGTTSVHSFTGAHGDEDEVPMGRSYDPMMQRQDDLYDVAYD